MKNRSWAGLALAVAIVAAFLLYMIAFEVPFTHTAVVTTFGRITRVITEPGLNWKWPPPIQQVTQFDNRIRMYESRMEQQYTADKQSIIPTVYVGWRIAPQEEAVVRYLKEIGSLEKAQVVLSGLAHDAMGKVVGEHPFEHFISTDPRKMQLETIEDELRELIARQALQEYGIEVATAGIKRLSLPEEATKKVFDRMKQERQQQAKQYRAEGESIARQIRADANRRASQIKNRAEAEARAIRGEGDAEAAKFYDAFAQHPELHNFVKWIQTLRNILSKRSTLIVDADTVPPFGLISSDVIKRVTEGKLSLQPPSDAMPVSKQASPD